MSTRIGPRMTEIVAMVTAYPGRSIRHAVRGLSYHGGESYQYGYAAARRALRAGLIENRGTASRYALYVTDKGAA